MSVPQEIIVDPAAIKELQLIEASLSDVDVELTAKQYLMTKDIFAQRQQTVAKIPAFWAVVFGNASSELDAAISERDSELLTSLTALEVTRPEIPPSAKVTDVGRDKFGEPRSFTIRLQFKENEFIADSVLEKTFHFRYTKGGSGGLTSTPVKINWKPGKDLTNGLSDAAYALWEAQRRQPNQQLEAVLDADARKARDAAAKELPEYKSLAKTLHDSRPNDVSFFTFFSYRGRWTSAAESQVARAELNAKRQAAIEGKPDEEEDDGEDDDDDEYAEDDVEVFPLGHDVAITIAEDIWPSAIDYFMEDTIDSDDDLDGIEIDDDDHEDEDVEMS